MKSTCLMFLPWSKTDWMASMVWSGETRAEIRDRFLGCDLEWASPLGLDFAQRRGCWCGFGQAGIPSKKWKSDGTVGLPEAVQCDTWYICEIEKAIRVDTGPESAEEETGRAVRVQKRSSVGGLVNGWEAWSRVVFLAPLSSTMPIVFCLCHLWAAASGLFRDCKQVASRGLGARQSRH